MLVALAVMAAAIIGVLYGAAGPRLGWGGVRWWTVRRGVEEDAFHGYDPGRELRAEQRARALLRSCVEPDDWEMYRDLGFLRVWGGGVARRPDGGVPYAYLIYPHEPLVAYVPQTGRLLEELCVSFPDETRPYGSSRLPDADDVLAKWMAVSADEQRLIAEGNVHQAGRQVDARRVQRDLTRLRGWERERLSRAARGTTGAGPRGGGVPTS